MQSNFAKKISKKTYLIFSLCLLNIGNVFSQNSLNFQIKNLGSGRTKISWNNNYKNISQISLQRSLDSLAYFTTVYSPSSILSDNYSFTDFYPLATKQVFYRVLFVKKGGEVLFSKSISRGSEGKYLLTLLPNINPRPTVSEKIEVVKQINSDTKIQEPVVSKPIEVISETVEIKKDSRSKEYNASKFIPQKSNLPETYPTERGKKTTPKNDETIVKEYKSKTTPKKRSEVESLLKTPVVKNKVIAIPLKKDTVVQAPKVDDDVVIVSSKKKKVTDKTANDSLKNNTIKLGETTTKKEFQDSIKKSSPVERKPSTTTTVRQYGAPGKLIGKVINAKTGDPLSGATVTIKGGSTVRTIKTDYNGVFSFSNIPSGIYDITCTYVGYSTNSLDEVKVVKDDVTTQDITMKESKGKDLDDVVIKSSSGSSKRNAETVSALLTIQKNAASVSDGISAEAIKRTPDRNTSDILKRVSGASIQDDKFAIIRGLSDRYNAVFLNSAPLPSTESDRKAFSFDIFPANMLDNLTIVKTATPDMPGEFAGGLIFINTKDIPAKDFQSVTFGLGYNTQATFRSRKYYKGGRFDLLGMDDGIRKLSANIPAAGLLPNDINIAAQQNFAKYIPNNWRTLEGISPANQSFQYVRGLNIERKQKDFLGLLIAATYNRTYNYTTGERNSIVYDRYNASQDPILNSIFSENTYSTQTLAGLMANLSYKINNNNKISLKNILSINSDDRVITRSGTGDFVSPGPDVNFPIVKWFTSNVIFSSQLVGEHFLPKSKLKINWAGAFSSVNRQIPNLRRTSSYLDANDNTIKQETPDITLSPDIGGTMFFASTKENLKSIKTDIERKLTLSNKFNIQLKAGAFYQARQRDFAARLLGLRKYNSGTVQFDRTLLNLSEAAIFDPKNFGKLRNGKGGFVLIEDYDKSNAYDASSNLFASYAMIDTRILKFIRINGGLRVETFNQKLNSFDDNSQPVKIDSTVTDYLPSVNLIFSLNAKQNFRLGYSKTLNRPEYRELAPFLFYDQASRISIFGNPNINRATIDNYDVRYEIYPGKGQLFSLSGFYKKIINPIELVLDPNIQATAKYQNAPKADIFGIELEARVLLSTLFKSSKKSILENLTAFGNIAFMKSEVDFGKDTVLYGANRTLQGQSPYLFNAGFIYQNENGFSSTIQINKVGQRIDIAGNVSDVPIWENGRPVVDLQIAKIFEKKGLEFKLNIKDILAQSLVKFYDITNNGKYEKDNSIDLTQLNKTSDKVFQRTNFGRVISASVTYKF